MVSLKKLLKDLKTEKKLGFDHRFSDFLQILTCRPLAGAFLRLGSLFNPEKTVKMPSKYLFDHRFSDVF
jgi:hypothetical protein